MRGCWKWKEELEKEKLRRGQWCEKGWKERQKGVKESGRWEPQHGFWCSAPSQDTHLSVYLLSLKWIQRWEPHRRNVRLLTADCSLKHCQKAARASSKVLYLPVMSAASIPVFLSGFSLLTFSHLLHYDLLLDLFSLFFCLAHTPTPPFANTPSSPLLHGNVHRNYSEVNRAGCWNEITATGLSASARGPSVSRKWHVGCPLLLHTYTVGFLLSSLCQGEGIMLIKSPVQPGALPLPFCCTGQWWGDGHNYHGVDNDGDLHQWEENKQAQH